MTVTLLVEEGAFKNMGLDAGWTQVRDIICIKKRLQNFEPSYLLTKLSHYQIWWSSLWCRNPNKINIFLFLQDLQQEQLSAPLTCCQWHENWSSGRKVGACQFLLVISTLLERQTLFAIQSGAVDTLLRSKVIAFNARRDLDVKFHPSFGFQIEFRCWQGLPMDWGFIADGSRRDFYCLSWPYLGSLLCPILVGLLLLLLSWLASKRVHRFSR